MCYIIGQIGTGVWFSFEVQIMFKGNRFVIGSFKKALVAAGVFAAISAGSSNAMAADILPSFTLDTTVFGGPNAALVGDKFTGNYNEVLTITSPGVFTTVAYYDLGQIVHNNGSIPYSGVQSGLGNNYSLYALFEASGTFSPNAAGDGFDIIATVGRFDLYVDRNLDTEKTLPDEAPGVVDIMNFSDDDKLASATLKSGDGRSGSGLAQGDFGLLFNKFDLTVFGKTFFTAPDPFYLNLIVKGQFNDFDPTVQTQTFNGSADSFFGAAAVPEPASLTLLGLGLAGLARRRRAAKA